MQNKIEWVKKEINVLQDRLKKNRKSQNQFQNGLMRVKKIRVKKRQSKLRQDFSQIKRIQNIVKNMLQNKIKKIKKNTNLLQNKLKQLKKGLDLLGKRQSLSQNGLTRIAKMQNLTQNGLDQITRMENQSRHELEQVAKIRRIKNYKRMSKEELIIALSKSKRSTAELFNNNLDNDKISDIKEIYNGLRDILSRKYRKEIQKKLHKIEDKENLSEQEKKVIDKLVRIHNKKEEYRHHYRDDPDCYGIRDIESLFGDTDDYYKPILAKN